MSELNFREQVDKYARDLWVFADRFNVPQAWFDEPDHVAVKGADRADYERWVELFKPQSEQISAIDMQGRTVAVAKLVGPLTVGRFGQVSLVEIMEPKPERVGRDIVGLEHMEFHYPHLTEVQDYLSGKAVAWAMQNNDSHAWVNVRINKQGQELKLNDRPLAEIIPEELRSGQSYIIHPAP